MRIATITPTRGDRPQFLKMALKLINLQTRQPDEIIVVNDPPKSSEIDINGRYHEGCKRAIEKGCDLLFFWEDDDYYAPTYIEAMTKAFEECNPQPQVFGVGMTVYYHLFLRKWGAFLHEHKASAMNTMITKEAYKQFRWPKDNSEKYDIQHGTGFLDTQLWEWAQRKKMSKTILYKPNNPLSIGIKHGMGKCGGSHHDKNESQWLMPLRNNDPNMSWLQQHVIPEAFEFYASLKE